MPYLPSLDDEHLLAVGRDLEAADRAEGRLLARAEVEHVAARPGVAGCRCGRSRAVLPTDARLR